MLRAVAVSTASASKFSSFFPWSTAYSPYSSSSCIRGNTGNSKVIKLSWLSRSVCGTSSGYILLEFTVVVALAEISDVLVQVYNNSLSI